MVDCSKCGKKIKLLSRKNRLDNGNILCEQCFNNWEKKQEEKNKEIITYYITKYLSNKDVEIYFCILRCHKNEDNLLDKDSLQRVTEHFQTLLSEVEYSNKSDMSSYEIDEIIETKKVCVGILEFLSDLEKMYKLFNKKSIDTNYPDILSTFAEEIEQRLNKVYDKILNPAYKLISKRLNKKISVENVIKEFMKTPLDIEYEFHTASKLLDKFGLEYDKEEVEKIIAEVQEDIGLEEFEQDLGSSQNINIGDFEKLTGYEFEGYLEGLFNLLGYTVLQTSLSGDQGADLIISKNGQKTVVQAKKYNGKVSNKAIQEVVAAQNHYKANKAIVITNSSFTKSAIDLALSNDVELWDGSKLKGTIQNLKSKKKEKGLSATKSLTLKKGKKIQKIKMPCPFCEEEFDYEIDVTENTNFETECPHCGAEIASKIKVSACSWSCEFCGKEFKTKGEAEKHEKGCTKRKK